VPQVLYVLQRLAGIEVAVVGNVIVVVTKTENKLLELYVELDVVGTHFASNKALHS
jgi:hypothetical protein